MSSTKTACSAGNHDLPAPSEGDAPGLDTSVTGALGINWGADNYDPSNDGTHADGSFAQDNNGTALTGRNVTFADATVGASGIAGSDLMSNGQVVKYMLADMGTTLIGYVGDLNHKVFVVSLSDDGTGAFKFSLLGPLDHAPNGSENDIDLTFHFTATDSDGDSATGSFMVGIDDDVPVVTAAGDTVSVNEANLLDDRNPNPVALPGGGFAGEAQAATGFFHINWGADNGDAKHLAFAKDSQGHVIGPQLTSDGVQLDYVVRFPSDSPDNEQIIAYKHGTDPDVAANVVFSISLYEQGHGYYTYVQYQNIDHQGSGTDVAQLNFNVIATDSDGDSVQTSLSVNVTDDTPHPVLTAPTAPVLIVDETAGQDSGTNDVASSPALQALFTGVSGSPVIQYAQSGAALFSTTGSTYGADGANGSAFGLSVTNGADSGLTATDGHKIFLYQEGNLVVGHEDNAAGKVAFAIAIDPATGQLSIAEYTAIQHPNHSDADEAASPQSITNDAIKVTYSMTDGDHDTVAASTGIGGLIQFRDDGPSVTPQTNLIVNGSFEEGHTELGTSGWSIYHSIPGWTTADIGDEGPTGDVPFEIQVGGVGGTPAQNGNALVELDADLSSGTVPADTTQHFNDSGQLNATIQQVVNGTTDGQTYELTFWYAPRIGEGGNDSGGLNVLWNGQIVKTINSDGMTEGQWQQITVFVEGTGADTIAFQGTGQANQLGALIDNVSLIAATVVDEDGLTNGHHDMPTASAGDIAVPDADGDHNEATATGLLSIKWGADNADSGVDTTGAMGAFVQDHPGGAGNRSVTFTDSALASFSGTLTSGSLTSDGQAITLSYNADHTVLTGTAGTGENARAVFEISLSDEGTGSYRFILLDRLDHASGDNENNIVLSFNFVATDSDGDTAPGTFTVVVNDDVPVLTGLTASGTVYEANIPVPTTTAIKLDFQSDTGAHAPNLSAAHLTVSGGSGIVVDDFNGVKVLGGPDQNPGAKPLIFTADAGTTFTLGTVLIGTFGATNSDLVTIKGTDTHGNVFVATVHVNAVGYLGDEPTTLFNSATTPLANVQLTQLEIDPPSSLAGRIVIDNLSIVETVTPATNYAQSIVDLAPLVDMGPDQPGTWSLVSFSAPQNVGTLSYNGTQVTMTSDGHTVTGVAGGTTIFTLSVDPATGKATFDLFKPVDGGLEKQVDFANLVKFTDYDGDSVTLGTGELIIKIDLPTDNLPVVTSATVSVNEAGLGPHGGLPAGSGEIADGIPGNNSDGSETHIGTIAIKLGDTPSVVTINDQVVTGTIGQTITGQFGTLTITSFSATSIGYSYTLTTNTSGETSHDDFTVKVTDADGTVETATGTLTINIVDDVPTAHADTDSVAAGQFTAETGNVISAVGTTSPVSGVDVQGADGAVVAGVAKGNTGADLTDATTVGQIVHGTYGDLTLNSDGSYSYVRAPGSAGGVNDVFTYTLKDGDGDLSHTTLTIAIGDSAPTDSIPAAGGATTTVNEAGLAARAGEPAGSDAAQPTTATGTIGFTSVDGLSEVSLGGHVLTGTAQTFADGTTGTLTASYTYDATTGVGTISYSYKLIDNTLTDPSAATFAVVVKDADGDAAPAGNLVVNIVDDAPVAHADSGSVVEGAVLSVAAANGVLANDVSGADGFAVAGAVVGVAHSSNTSSPVSGSVGSDVAGNYGTLHLNSDGSYTYHATANDITANATETFVYTVKDGDGDLSTTTLTINVNNVTLVATDTDASVDEAGLATGSHHGDGSNIATGSIAVSGGTGSYAYELTSQPANPHGTLTLGADGKYTYTLTSPVTESSANNGADTVSGVDSFGYKVTDGNGNTTTGTIVVDVKDDVPTAHTDSATVTEGALLSISAASGVLANDVSGADGFAVAGAVVGVAHSSNTSSPVSGSVGSDVAGSYGTLHLNADGSYTYHATANDITANATDTFVYTVKDGDGDLSTTTLTINVNNVTLVATDTDASVDEAGLANGTHHGDGSNVGAGSIGVSGGSGSYQYALTGSPTGSHGSLVLNSDGTYTYTLTSPVTEPTANNGTDTVNGDSFGYKVTDGNGNTTTGTIQVSVKDDVPTAQGETANVAEASSTNVVFMIDTSGSTDGTALAREKQAAVNLLNAGINGGQVLVVDFNDSAHVSGWMTVSNAITYINGLSADGDTNYDLALSTTQTYINTHTTPDAGQTIAYFLSDGQPNEPSGSVGINSTEQAAWDFVPRDQSHQHGLRRQRCLEQRRLRHRADRVPELGQQYRHRQQRQRPAQHDPGVGSHHVRQCADERHVRRGRSRHRRGDFVDQGRHHDLHVRRDELQ